MKINKIKNEYITATNYWSYSNLSDTGSTLRKSLKRLLNEKILSLLGLKLVGLKSDIHPEQKSFIVSKEIILARNKKIASYLLDYFSKYSLDLNNLNIEQDIVLYDSFFRDSKISSLNGGMGYNNGLVTFLICKYIQPKNIIESGVWRGFTTYLLEKASPENAQITCYDINLKNIEYSSINAEYYEMDISENTDCNHNDCDLAFFDDHVSHYDRLHFCNNNNIKFVILDDDVTIFSPHSDGWPPLPSSDMVYNYNNIPKNFKWVINNIDASANIDNLDITPIINNYKRVPYPDLSGLTGYKDTSATTLLIKNAI